MEADTKIGVQALECSKDVVDHELIDTDLSQKLFYEGITKLVGLLSQWRQSLCFVVVCFCVLTYIFCVHFL
jgi:hypothetical protein